MKQGFLCILYWCIILYPVERKNTNGNELPDQTSKSVLNCNYLKTWHETARPLTCHVGFFYYPIDKRLIISIRKLSTYLHSYVIIHMSCYKDKTILPKGNYVTRLDFKTHHHSFNKPLHSFRNMYCTSFRGISPFKSP